MQGLLVRLRPVGSHDYGLVAAWTGFSAAGVLASAGQADALDATSWQTAIEQRPSQYAVIETHAGDKIGLVSWRQLQHDRSFTVGAVVGDQRWWDSGVGLEGAMLAVDYLFQCEAAHRVEMVAAGYNRRSLAFLTKGDVVVEGVLRDYMFADGQYHDAVICSMSREEYLAPLDGYLPTTRLITEETERAAADLLRGYLTDLGADYLRRLLCGRLTAETPGAPGQHPPGVDHAS